MGERLMTGSVPRQGGALRPVFQQRLAKAIQCRTVVDEYAGNMRHSAVGFSLNLLSGVLLPLAGQSCELQVVEAHEGPFAASAETVIRSAPSVIASFWM